MHEKRPDRDRGRRRPTVKQVYALARELCERAGEEFPDTVPQASELIARLRAENGKADGTPPAARLPVRSGGAFGPAD